MAKSADVKEFRSVIKHKESISVRYSHPEPAPSAASALSFSISKILGLEETTSTPPPLLGRRPSSSSSSDESVPSSFGSPSSSGDQSSENEERKASESEKAPRKSRRSRTTFRANQVRQLECAFALSSYLSYATEDELSKRLELTTRQIRTWFQNRRGKHKRELDELNQFTNKLSWSHCEEQVEDPVQKTANLRPWSVQSYQIAAEHNSPVMQHAPYYPDDQRRHLVQRNYEVCSSQLAPLRLRGFHRYLPYRCPVVYQGPE